MKKGFWAGLTFGIALLGLVACNDNEAQATEGGSAKTKRAAVPGAAPQETPQETPRVRRESRLVDMGDLPKIRQRGSLRIAVLPRVPEPVSVKHRPATADRLLAERFARSLGLQVQLVAAETRDALFEMLERGEVDLAAGNLTITKSRKERFGWSRPTRVVREVLVGRRGKSDNPKTPEQLAGREVFV